MEISCSSRSLVVRELLSNERRAKAIKVRRCFYSYRGSRTIRQLEVDRLGEIRLDVSVLKDHADLSAAIELARETRGMRRCTCTCFQEYTRRGTRAKTSIRSLAENTIVIFPVSCFRISRQNARLPASDATRDRLRRKRLEPTGDIIDRLNYQMSDYTKSSCCNALTFVYQLTIERCMSLV